MSGSGQRDGRKNKDGTLVSYILASELHPDEIVARSLGCSLLKDLWLTDNRREAAGTSLQTTRSTEAIQV